MKKLFSRFTALELLLGLLIVLVIVGVAILGYGIYLYQAAIGSKEAGITQAEEIAMENSPLKEIETTGRYHGSELYFIVEGSDEEGKELIVFVPDPESELNKVQSFLRDDLFSEDEVLSSWNGQCSGCSLIKYNWAIENETPLMEVTYISQNDRYVLEYYDLKNGGTYQRLPLKKSLY